MALIEELLGKGLALTADDLQEIEAEIALMPLDQAHEREPWIREGIALIVNDPDYRGDIPPIK